MKITGLQSVIFEPTWDDPYAAKLQRTLATLTISTDEGLTGISRGTADQIRVIHDIFAPLLFGEDPRAVERLWTKLEQTTVSRLGQEPLLISAIGVVDIALWDLLGKATGQPCWRLLGGYRDSVEAYADIPIRDRTPAGLAQELVDCVDDGYRSVKFHIVDYDPDHIVACTEAARAAMGPEPRLMVDIFRALDPWTAIDVARRIEHLDIHWLEEPVRWHDNPRGLALVAQNTTIPVAGGEGESTIFGARAILEQAGLAYLQCDTLTIGGYTPLRKAAGIAEGFHARLAPHGATFPELSAHLVAAVPNGAMVPATTRHFPPAIWHKVYESFDIVDGMIQLSEAPGLGLAFDSSFLAAHQIGAIG
jgi:L-alanine-DL-glutamate epimerase-like enolase superfamily enzyme